MSVGFSAASCGDLSSTFCTDIGVALPTAGDETPVAVVSDTQLAVFRTVDDGRLVGLWRGRLIISISCW